MERFEARTVALLNRGVPSFAVDTDGTLHTALMRSCTGWPSGIWIDEPRRTAPDGSNFQLQHWTHAFDYALVCGDGDWRRAGIPARSAQFSHPLLAVVPDQRGGTLPPTGSLLRVEPADSVHLGALKAAGNPLTAGSAKPVDPGAVALRLVETNGAAARVVIGSALGKVRALRAAPTCWKTRGDAKRSIDLHGYQVATVLARLDVPTAFSGGDDRATALAPHAESVQPLYARYWLHNRGPAPLGRAAGRRSPAPAPVTAEPGGDGGVAAHRGQRLQRFRTGAARWRWCARTAGRPRPPSCRSRCAAASTWRSTWRWRFRPTPNPGCTRSGPSCASPATTVPTAWRQVVEDVCVVAVGGDEVDLGDLVYLVDGPAEVDAAGRRHGPADRHGRHPRLRRPGAGGASDQPVGHLGVDRPGRARRGAARPRHRRARLRRHPAGLGWSPASGGRWSGSAAPAGWSTRRR